MCLIAQKVRANGWSVFFLLFYFKGRLTVEGQEMRVVVIVSSTEACQV